MMRKKAGCLVLAFENFSGEEYFTYIKDNNYYGMPDMMTIPSTASYTHQSPAVVKVLCHYHVKLLSFHAKTHGA